MSVALQLAAAEEIATELRLWLNILFLSLSRTPSLFLSFFLYSTLSFPLYFPGETIKFSGL